MNSSQIDIPTSASPRRPQARGEKTRQRLLDAASKLFAERGYEGTSISDVAREAGVGVGTVYHHFADKRELLLELLRTFEGQVVVEGSTPGSGGLSVALSEDDVRGRMLSLCQTVVELRRRKPGLYAIGREVGRREPELADVCAQIDTQHRSRIARDIEAGQRSGKVRVSLDAEAAAFVVHNLLRVGITQIAEGDDTDRDAQTKALAEMVCSYLLVD